MPFLNKHAFLLSHYFSISPYPNQNLIMVFSIISFPIVSFPVISLPVVLFPVAVFPIVLFPVIHIVSLLFTIVNIFVNKHETKSLFHVIWLFFICVHADYQISHSCMHRQCTAQHSSACRSIVSSSSHAEPNM